MNVTHFDCGTLREIPADDHEPARAVCQCLVVEASLADRTPLVAEYPSRSPEVTADQATTSHEEPGDA